MLPPWRHSKKLSMTMLVFLPYCGIRWRYADHKKQDTVKFKAKEFEYLEDKASGILNRVLQIPNLVRIFMTNSNWVTVCPFV